jgi:hypothetical protein
MQLLLSLVTDAAITITTTATAGVHQCTSKVSAQTIMQQQQQQQLSYNQQRTKARIDNVLARS